MTTEPHSDSLAEHDVAGDGPLRDETSGSVRKGEGDDAAPSKQFLPRNGFEVQPRGEDDHTSNLSEQLAESNGSVVNAELRSLPEQSPLPPTDERTTAHDCLACGTPRMPEATFCEECGLLFPEATVHALAITPQAGTVVGGRYQLNELIGQRDPVLRFRGHDLGAGSGAPLPVVIVRQSLSPEPEQAPAAPVPLEGDLFALPLTEMPDAAPDLSSAPTTIQPCPDWPGLVWERLLLTRTAHLSLPRVLDTFKEDGFEYLVIEIPEGRSFWDAWDEQPVSWPRRLEWLIQIAEALSRLHRCGAMLEGVRPDAIVITPIGQAAIVDLAELLPLPLPAGVPVRGGLYSAPELTFANEPADARADLYSFGAMVHALLLGRELTELDFALQGVPRPYLEWYPDGHPMLGRLLARTFTRDPDCRFPSREYMQADPTGFEELIEFLRACSHSLNTIRLEIAAWTNTGVVRAGNEDAVAFLHSTESRLEENDDFAVLLLADGMGGMASGEVAAAITIETIRDYFLKHPPFTDLLLEQRSDAAPTPKEAVGNNQECHRQNILEALYEANQAVFEESRTNVNYVGMGCTAEVVVIDGSNVVIGHVGDSRTFHHRNGQLVQITRDQTLVSQLVVLGQLTEEEAASHPQRSELQQAIGGRKDVYPDTYSLPLEAGDWLLVCSDGLTNQLTNVAIAAILQGAASAERAARRLVNQAILEGALDNVSVVVVRAC